MGGVGYRTCWRPLLFMRQCDPLCHPLSARGVCLHRCSLCSLYQPRVANEKHQVNTTTRTAMALNLLIHLDTTNWNPCELCFGTHPFSCRPQLKGKSSLMEIYRVMPGLTHLEPDLVLFLPAIPANDNQFFKIKAEFYVLALTPNLCNTPTPSTHLAHVTICFLYPLCPVHGELAPIFSAHWVAV